MLSLTEDFVIELQELCQTKIVDQPEYKTLSNKRPYRIKCYALDQIAYGEFYTFYCVNSIIILMLNNYNGKKIKKTKFLPVG